MSRSSSSSASTSQTETFNLGLQESEGAIAAVGSTISVLDGGAVRAGTDVARAALSTGERNLDLVADTLERGQREAFSFAAGAQRQAADLADASIDAITRGQQQALSAVESVSTGAVRAVGDAATDALHFGRDVHATSLDVVSDAFARTTDLAERFAGELRTAYEGVGQFVERQGQQFLGAVERFQARESTNVDARLQDITRTGLIVAGVVAVGALGAWAWSRG